MAIAYRVTVERITLNSSTGEQSLLTQVSEYYFDLEAAGKRLHDFLTEASNDLPDSLISLSHIKSDIDAAGIHVQMSKVIDQFVHRAIIQQIDIQ